MAKVLIVDDDAALREGLAETVADLGHAPRFAASGREALAALAAATSIACCSICECRAAWTAWRFFAASARSDNALPVIVLTAFATAENTIEAMRLGALDHLTKPVGRKELDALLTAAAAGAAIRQRRRTGDTSTLIGSSEAMRRVQKTIGLAADSDATVLILGETGTGKELVARALHRTWRAQGKPFVAVNCAAIPADLLESELFGHVKGSFTGATADRVGAFREAAEWHAFSRRNRRHAGGDARQNPARDRGARRNARRRQAMPVRRSPDRGDAPRSAEPRRATARSAKTSTTVSTWFRSCCRPCASGAKTSCRSQSTSCGARRGMARSKRLAPRLRGSLLEHSWPGNVRELRNMIARACVLVRGETIEATDLDIAPAGKQNPSRDELLEGDLPSAVAKLEAAMIRAALEACGGNRTEAARRLNINRQLLYTKMQRYGLEGYGLRPKRPQTRHLLSGKPTT